MKITEHFIKYIDIFGTAGGFVCIEQRFHHLCIAPCSARSKREIGTAHALELIEPSVHDTGAHGAIEPFHRRYLFKVPLPVVRIVARLHC